MADTNLQPIDGRVVVDIDLGTEQSPDPLLVTGQFAYIRSILDEPIGGWKTYTHQIQAATRDLYLTRLLPKLFGDRLVRFRIGIKQGTVTAIWRAWETHYILEAHFLAGQQNASKSGYTFRLVTADRLYTMNLLERLQVKAGTIDQLVNQLVSTYSFPGAAVEATKDKFSFIQTFQTDYEFLLERLAPAANNTRGLGNYQVYVQDDQLHFHTPGWKINGVKTLTYGVPGCAASNLTFMDRLGTAQLEGAGGVRNIAYVPLTGASPTHMTQEALTLCLADITPEYERIKHVLTHVGQNQMSHEVSEAQTFYERPYFNTFRISFKFPNQPFLRPGDVVDLQLASPDDPWSGLYYLYHSLVSVVSGRMMGVYTFCRGELTAAQENFSGLDTLDPDAIVGSTYAAQGIKFNTATASTSSLTAGTGSGPNEQGGTTIEVDTAPCNGRLRQGK